MHHYNGTANGAMIQDLAMTFWKQRDETSFTKLYNALKPGLVTYAKNIVKREDDINDAVDNTLIKVWSKIDLYNPEVAKYTTWIYNIHRNECLQILKKIKTRKELPLVADVISVQEAFEFDIIEPVDYEMLYEAAIESISGLRDIYRDAVVLHDLKGMKYKDIAEKLGIDINTVKTHISRGRAIVRKQLA